MFFKIAQRIPNLTRETASVLALATVLFTFGGSAYSQGWISYPSFSEEEIRNNYDKYISNLDSFSITRKYPEIVRKILSSRSDQQEVATRMLGESGDVYAIPWLLLLIDSKDQRLSTYSGLAVKDIVSSIALKRRDPGFHEFTVLKPIKSKDIDIKPLAWIALKFLRSDDPNLIAYGIMMSRYMNLYEFESTILGHKDNINPAVTNTMKWAINELEFQKQYDAGELKPKT